MPVPKQRHTKSRRNRRRSHDALKKSTLALCPQCSQSIKPHQVCGNCGYYKGVQVIDVLAKLEKKEKKAKEKELAEQKEQATSMEEMSKK